MAYLEAQERYEIQHDVLAEVLPDSYFPTHPIVALNKRLHTDQKVIIRAINELLSKLNNTQTSTNIILDQTFELFGDFLKNIRLKEDLEKVSPTAIEAILHLHKAIFGDDLDNPAELEKSVAEILSNLEIPEGSSAITSVFELTDVLLSSLKNNDVLRYDASSQKWVNKNLNDVYLQKVDTEARFDRLFIGDKTTNSNKYIYADIGKSIATTSPSLRFAIDDPIAKTGHWEFSNDGENFNALGQMELITDIKIFDNVAHEASVTIDLVSTVDSSFNRIVTVYCKEVDPENEENSIWSLYPTTPNFDGIGFDILEYNNKTVIKNNTGSTQDIKILIQYIASNILNNVADIVDTNGYLTLFKNSNTETATTNTYTLLHEDTFFANFDRHDPILYIGLVEKVSNFNSYGNCRIEITDGHNTITQALGSINNTKHKHTNIKMDCGFLDGTLKKWTIRIYGMVSSNSYIIERYVVKAKPRNIAMEDFVTYRNIDLQTSSDTYYQLDNFSFFGGYKVMPNSYFYAVVDYSIIGNITDASIQLVASSGGASQTTTQQLNLTNSAEEFRIKCPVLLDNLINFKLSAKVTGSGSIKINTYHIYIEM